MKRFFCALLLGFAALAHATIVSPTGGIGLTYSAGNVGMTDGAAFEKFIGRVLTADTAGGGASIVERYGVSVANGTLEVAATRALSPTVVAAAAAVAFAAGVELAAPINVALGHTDVSFGTIGCVATLTGWKCRETQAATGGGSATFYAVCSGAGYSVGVPACAGDYSSGGAVRGAPTRVAACEGYRAWIAGQVAGATLTTCDPGGYVLVNCGGYNCASNVEAYTAAATSSCPAYVDALNPAWSGGAGSSQPVNGQCPTGRYNAATTGAIATALAPQLTPAITKEVADKILGFGQPIPGVGERVLSGPATVPAPSPKVETTTNPDGTTKTTTTTQGTTVTYPPAAPGSGVSNVSYSTVVTTTINNAGNITTTTVNNGADPAPDPADPCTANPGRAGCAQLGTAPAPDPIPNVDIPTTVSPITFITGSGCPAPINFSFTVASIARSYNIEYTPLCNLAIQLAPIFTAMFAAAAAFIFMDGVNRL